MKIFSFAVLLLLLFHGISQQADYPQLKSAAESAYAEGSYARAHEIYNGIDKPALPQTEARWVEFRVADTLWRSQAATDTADNTKYEQAHKQLAELIRNLENGVKLDSKPDASIVQRGGQASDPSVMATAHWGEDGIFWRWSVLST